MHTLKIKIIVKKMNIFSHELVRKKEKTNIFLRVLKSKMDRPYFKGPLLPRCLISQNLEIPVTRPKHKLYTQTISF